MNGRRMMSRLADSCVVGTKTSRAQQLLGVVRDDGVALRQMESLNEDTVEILR